MPEVFLFGTMVYLWVLSFHTYQKSTNIPCMSQWCHICWFFPKGHWPLDDLVRMTLLRSHVWLYPRFIMSKSHVNTSKYVDTVTLFSKNLNQRSLTLDDLWPHICWCHMCDSTQGSLCLSPMGTHQCMWIQWSIFAKYHILCTEWVIT